MTKKEIKQLEELLAKYCNEEIKKGNCFADSCDECPINEARNRILG